MVNWFRLIRPDGTTISIGSPAGDPLGRGGIRASVNSHFFQRFAGAILQSALDIGVALAGPAPITAAPSSSCRAPSRTRRRKSSSNGPDHADPDGPPGNEHQHLRRPRPRFHRRREPGGERRAANDGGIYLRPYLAPLTGVLARPDVTDIYVNRPRRAVDRDDRAARSSATTRRTSPKRRSRGSPARSRRSPTRGSAASTRALGDPARRRPGPDRRAAGDARPLALAIRKHVSPDLALDDYVAAGAFGETRGRQSPDHRRRRPGARRRSSKSATYAGMLAAAVRAAQEHPGLRRHLDRQDDLPQRAAARDPGRASG